MRLILLFLITSISTGYANNPLRIKEIHIQECSEKNRSQLFEDLSNLSEYHLIDTNLKSTVFFLTLPLLDMIKSSEKKITFLPIKGAIRDFNLSLQLSPLPSLVTLDEAFHPRFTMRCSTFEQEKYNELACNLSPTKDKFGLDEFSISLKVFDQDTDPSCLSKIIIDYNVLLNKDDFALIQRETSRKLKEDNKDFFAVVIKLFKNPRYFFKTYWIDFYKVWLSR